jgi:hypothetical protein
MQLELGLRCLPPLSERIGPKSKNATNSTDSISPTADNFNWSDLPQYMIESFLTNP